MMINKFKDTYAFLNNSYLVDIKWNGKIFSSSEHLYQAQKTENPEDIEKIRLASSPKRAKRMGRQIEIRPLWDEFKFAAMYVVLLEKFNQNFDLQEQLLNTGDEELIKNNNHNDVYWGVCNGVGINCLGRILMDIRNKIKIKRLSEAINCMDED